LGHLFELLGTAPQAAAFSDAGVVVDPPATPFVLAGFGLHEPVTAQFR